MRLPFLKTEVARAKRYQYQRSRITEVAEVKRNQQEQNQEQDDQ